MARVGSFKFTWIMMSFEYHVYICQPSGLLGTCDTRLQPHAWMRGLVNGRRVSMSYLGAVSQSAVGALQAPDNAELELAVPRRSDGATDTGPARGVIEAIGRGSAESPGSAKLVRCFRRRAVVPLRNAAEGGSAQRWKLNGPRWRSAAQCTQLEKLKTLAFLRGCGSPVSARTRATEFSE